MKVAAAIDFNQPESAKAVGGELAVTTRSLTSRLTLDDETITEQGSCAQAVLDRQSLGAAAKRVEEFFEPFISMAHKLHKSLCDRKTEILAPILLLDAAKRVAIRDYNAAQDRVRQQRERDLAEQQRRDEQTRAAQEAAALEQQGDHAMAAAVLEDAIAAPLPVVALPNEVRAVAKFRRRYLWRFAGGPADVAATPPAVLARALAALPMEFHCVDEAKIGAYARSMKGTGQVPGVEFYHVDDPIR